VSTTAREALMRKAAEFLAKAEEAEKDSHTPPLNDARDWRKQAEEAGPGRRIWRPCIRAAMLKVAADL
jgi:hypothetical protein